MKRILSLISVFALGISVNAQIIYDQTASASTSGVISDYMTDNGSIVRCADNFVVPTGGTWEVSSVTVRGFRNGTGPTMDSMLVEIYTNVAGAPGAAIYSDVHMLGVGGVPSPQGDTSLTITIPTQTLTAGTYWLSVSGYAPAANRWNWLAVTGSAINGDAKLIDADDFFGAGATSWTDFSDLGLADPNLAFTINGTDYYAGLSENEVSLSIYPNPVENNLFIAIQGTTLQQVNVYNLNGQLVVQSGNATTIDVSSLEAGVYMIEINTADGILNKRFVKM